MARGLGICGRDSRLPAASVEIGGFRVGAGFFELPEPDFDEEAQRGAVLVEVSAFSCNFRDRALVLRMATAPLPDRFYVVGSELAGRALAVGRDVERVRPGDRVMIDGAYADGPRPWGLPTNHASRSVQVLPAAQLRPVPGAMDDATAASFVVGAQTSFAMVRRARLGRGDRVLVTAGSSNTSLFLLAAARHAGAEVWLTTTSERNVDRLLELGAAGVAVVDGETPFERVPALRDALPFAAVLDPFFDLYLGRALGALAVGGRYVTCGFEAQFPTPAELEAKRRPPRAVLDDLQLARAATRNVELVGNCLGTRADLDAALAAWETGALPVTLDAVLGDGAVEFLDRTFGAHDRFGKVVYRYS